MSVRDNLSRVAAKWRTLTETQRAEWMAAATAVKSTSRLGQNGALSGFQLFTKINYTLVQFGQADVQTPPLRPQFPDLVPQNLVITSTGGVVALKLTCPTDPGENTIVRGSTPVSQGVEVCKDFRILGVCVPRPCWVRLTLRAHARRLATASSGPYAYKAMNVAIENPENVCAPLRSRWKDVPRRVLEAVAAEAYRSGALTAHQVGELLGHGSRWETESFLKGVQAYLHYGEDDLERDLVALRAARG